MPNPDTNHRGTGAEAIDLSDERLESGAEQLASGMHARVAGTRSDLEDMGDELPIDADPRLLEIALLEDQLKRARANPKDNMDSIRQGIVRLEALQADIPDEVA